MPIFLIVFVSVYPSIELLAKHWVQIIVIWEWLILGVGESFFSTFYTLVLLFPSGPFWKRKTWRLSATWKSISQDDKITGSVVFEYHTIRYLLWVEQPRIVLWKHLIHTVCGPHPRELNEKENAYQCISRAFLGMLRFQEVCEREKRCFENLIRITYLNGRCSLDQKIYKAFIWRQGKSLKERG